MPDARVIEWIREKFRVLVAELDERGRRRWADTEARSLGWGGVSAVAVAAATGISDRTIRNGIAELDAVDPLPSNRQRRTGGGRKSRKQEQPGLVRALERLVEPESRGDPRSPLRWTCKSTRKLAGVLRNQGFQLSDRKVGRLLKAAGYSLQSYRRNRQGTQHPDRDAQFRHINRRVAARQRRGEPSLPVDTKKKKVPGDLKNAGKTYRPEGEPVEMDVHDFPDPKLGKAIPRGVFDPNHNEAGVSIGITHDTDQFAVGALRRWWERLGKARYRSPRRILTTADSGGGDSSRNRPWKFELQKFAYETGMIIEVCHFPPGTSKWNKIEHRVFCHITRNRQGVAPESLEVVVQLIRAILALEGLQVHAWLDEALYEKGRKAAGAEMAEIQPTANRFHGEWN